LSLIWYYFVINLVLFWHYFGINLPLEKVNIASDEVLKILTYKAEKSCAYITSIFPLS